MRAVLLICLALLTAIPPLGTHAAAQARVKSRHFWLGGQPDRLCAGPAAIPQPAIFVLQAGMPDNAPPPASVRDADPLYWNELAIELIVKYQRNPLRAARVLTLLNTAMHDALACARLHKLQGAAKRIAVDSVAAHLLEFLFPQEPEGRFQALALGRQAELPQGDLDQASARARAIGWKVALAAMERAIADDSDAVWNVGTRPKPGPGIWRATPPTYGNTPAEPMAGNWRTWVLRDGGEVQPSPPPAPDSERYRREVEEVLAVSTRLTREQKAIAERWHLDQGTVTPVGVWNRETIALIRSHRLSLEQTMKVLSTVNVAMMDALIACWRVKYTYWTERPVTAIRERLDPDFLPLLVTPSFPSYVSGHAAVSGAASAVLAEFFPRRRTQLNAMAEEAAMSRLYGGIHFRSDNDEGFRLGRQVASKVLARLRGRP